MKANFYKMQSLGNDYIYFDCCFDDQNKSIAGYLEQNACAISKSLCGRRISIGADGIVLILPSQTAHAYMVIFNSDGSRAKMCGNALRAVGYFLSQRLSLKIVNVQTDSGLRRVYCDSNCISTEMGRAKFITQSFENFYDKRVLSVIKESVFCEILTVGNPHLVLMVNDLKKVDFGLIAPLLSKNDGFDGGLNVEIATINLSKVTARVYERGSGETLSCGTGACAVIASAVKNKLLNFGRNKVAFTGGELFVDISKDFSLQLAGGVNMVFKGVVEV